MLRAIKRVKHSLSEWVPSAFGFEGSGAPRDEFPYVPPTALKREYMEERWTALPPRRRKRARAGGDTTASGEEGGTRPPTPSTPDGGATFAARAASNADAVAEAVAARVVANRADRPSVPSAPEKVFRGNWEHLDHTADVQFHAWGGDLADALRNLARCFFDYVTELDTVEEDAGWAQAFDVEGADLEKFLFRYLDELLYRFCAESVVCRDVAVALAPRKDGDPYAARITTTGERFDLAKHPQGTEVKAITYSAMQVHATPDRTDIFVIVDI